jgi:hypothetical protein
VALGHMCNVNIYIMSGSELCYVGSHMTSFIIARGVGMKFNVCYNILKS